MYLLIFVVLLISSCITGNVDILKASGLFAIAATVADVARRK